MSVFVKRGAYGGRGRGDATALLKWVESCCTYSFAARQVLLPIHDCYLPRCLRHLSSSLQRKDIKSHGDALSKPDRKHSFWPLPSPQSLSATLCNYLEFARALTSNPHLPIRPLQIQITTRRIISQHIIPT